ncbi:hypothetical protein GCM10022403_077000 [Streptomyces coacervatus]|uniref:Uncharacterized protein n=1 Tax=Streptomyces coacervatus TaxID=647381 RepID=A0ABP7J1Q9_9ACTN
MAQVTAHIWHQLDGRIVAVGQPMGGALVTPIGDENTSVIETTIEESLLGRLHETHVVNVERMLVSKDASQ